MTSADSPTGSFMRTEDFCCSGLVRVTEHLYTVESLAHSNKQEHIEHRQSHHRLEAKMEANHQEAMKELKEVRELAAKDQKTWLYWVLGVMVSVNMGLLAWLINHLSNLNGG